MSYLGSGTLPYEKDTCQGVLQVAKYISMTEDGKVWVDDPRIGTKREVLPLHEREAIVRQILNALGFPYGH